ncbi:MAG: AMP-binding protein [Zoogloeaceae bacterium]|jgi:acyl-CoA synthetase (AMP-forming)/AMP-acid ligase II/3-hydroxymyristoyl/3-hydroxydecanoyl-(acyl carrier protein) dehydratase|nr:AMP-binding protein [Zoogloeaceae bacterium]
MPEAFLRDFTRRFPLADATDHHIVAWREGRPITHADFLCDIALARRSLATLEMDSFAGHPAIALFEPDVHAFNVWLLAAWSLDMKVALMGDDLPATRKALALPWIGREHPANALSNWHTTARALPRSRRDPVHPGFTLFTSGSTGKPTPVEKTLAQSRAESQMLETAFGAQLTPETRFVSSVPHPHMYGLAFFVLWPLLFARPYVVEKCRYPEDLERLPAADYLFVTSPTFLKHLTDASLGLAPRARWRLATSAGSPLANEIAASGAAFLKAPIAEIYGSTETGAAAYRHGTAPWQPLPGVRFSLDAATSRLRIQSPALSLSERKSGFLSGDFARLDEQGGGLELLGRADRLVKIGEKRISLTQVEVALLRLPDIDKARVVPLQHEHEGRLLLGVAAILTPAGNARKERLGKARFDRFLRAALRERIEPVALPRRWRYVTTLPTNDMGKSTQGDLERLFAPTLPHALCLAQSQDESMGRARLQLHCGPNLVWFDGHFPDLPVLPGVTQIDWAAHFAHLHFSLNPQSASITRMNGLKFQHLIRPNDAPCLDLVWRPDKREIEFAYTLAGTPCSRGTLVFTEDVRA